MTRKILGFAALLLFLAVVGVLWIVATESGTRWLVARLEDRLPAELSIGAVSGSLLDGVAAEFIAWRSDGLQLEAGRTEIEFQLLPLARRRLVVESLDVEDLALKLSDSPGPSSEEPAAGVGLPIDIALQQASIRNIEFVRGDLQRTIERLSVSGDLEGDQLRLSRLELRSAWLDLGLSGSGTLASRLPLDLQADWTWRTGNAETFRGHLQASGNLEEYRIRHELEAPLPVSSNGTIAYTDRVLRVDLLSNWTGLQWALGERKLQSSQGSLRLTGQLDDFLVELDTGIRIDDHPEARARLSGAGQWIPLPRFDLAYDLGAVDPTLASAYLAGSLESHGTLGIVIDHGTPDIAVEIASLGGELNGYTVDGRASVHYANHQTTVRGARVRLGDNTIAGDARLSDTLSVDAELDLANLAQIAVDARGSLRGRIDISGNLAQPEVDVDLHGADIAWNEIAFAAIDAKARVEGDQRGRAEITIKHATIASLPIDAARVTLTGQPGRHELQSRLEAYGSSLEIDANGRYAAPSWTLDLERVQLANDPLGTWSSLAASQLQLEPGQARLQRTCLAPADGAGEACLLADHGTAASTIELSIDALPLAALPVTLPPGISLHGSIRAGLRAQRTEQQLTAHAELELPGASIDALYDGEQITLDLAEAEADASFVDGRLESSARVALADGAGSAHARLALHDGGAAGYPVDGRADILIDDASVFAVFFPSIKEPRGRIEGELTVAGVASAPEFVGEISIRDGAFGVRQSGIEVSDVEARIAQSEAGQVQLSGRARSGDGYLAIDGITRIGQETGIRSEIRLQGENFELARLPDWQIIASPSITAIFDNHVTTIVGQLAIPSASVTIREIPETAQKASPDAVVHREDGEETARRRRIDLHLRTSLGDDVQFSGFGLTTGLEGAIQLRGGTHAPYTGQGRLSLIGGRYTAYGQELEIERGNLLFNGPLDEPLLDIRAIRRTPDVIAGIQLNGTPSRLQSDIFSEPALGDAEALSYLLTGRPLTSSMNTGEGDTLNQAAFALGLSGAGLITSQIRSQLGLETLTIEGSKDESRLVAGKRLGNRLLVEYGYGLVDKLGTLLLRYQLNDRFMLESRSGTVSNLDLLYRARKK